VEVEREAKKCIWFRNCTTRWEFSDLILSTVLGNFKVPNSFCLHSAALVSTQHLTEVNPRNFVGGEVRLVHRADNSAILVVLCIKIRMEAQHFISLLSLHDLLRESFMFLP